MKVDIVIKKMVKPSRATPVHRRVHNIGCIDRLQYPGFGTIIFFYRDTGKHQEWMLSKGVDCLEKSLSEVLTLFSPLAGRYNESDSSIDCNDEGVEFVVATVDAKLDRLAKEKFNPGKIRDFVTFRYSVSCGAPMVVIQVNVFDCGGLAINVSISHILVDMQALSMFVDSWATTSRLNIQEVVIRPDFDSSARFLSQGELRIKLPSFKLREEKFVMDRFEFDVQSLRNEFGASRVVLVSALISMALLDSVQQVKRGQMPSTLSIVHAMNLRGRTTLPVAANYFGNMYTRTIIRSTVTETFGLSTMVNLIQGGLREAFGRYSEVTSDYDLCSMVMKETEELFREEGSHLIAFSSLCGFGIYENDFGFGKPVMVTSICAPFRLALLMDRKSGDRIDAWISLSESDMALFKLDPNITAFSKF